MDEEHYRRLIAEGVEPWNRWRAASAVMPQLEGASLIEVKLTGADLRGADLRHALLMGADLTGADLSGARLDGANLMGTRITQARLDGASLAGAILQGVDWVGAKLAGLDLSRANLSGANLNAADLTGTTLDDALAAPVRLDGATLAAASLRRVNLTGASLSRAVLTNADLSAATLLSVWASAADFTGARLAGADLRMADLSDARLVGADLTDAKLMGTQLFDADLTGARLAGAVFNGAGLMRACLADTDLTGIDLSMANLSFANCRGATLVETNLAGALLVRTDFTGARLHGALVFGTAAWDVILDEADQKDLRVTRLGQPRVVVDNLEVAQFVYLLLSNQRIRAVLETVTSKAVLLLGRFSPERKPVLDALREALRQRGWVPVMFDFEPVASRDFTETIQILAGLARFVIVDLTDARSAPQELASFVPQLPSVPVQPIIQSGHEPWAIFADLPARYAWVRPPHVYDDVDGLLRDLDSRIVGPALARSESPDRDAALLARIRQLESENAALRGRGDGGG